MTYLQCIFKSKSKLYIFKTGVFSYISIVEHHIFNLKLTHRSLSIVLWVRVMILVIQCSSQYLWKVGICQNRESYTSIESGHICQSKENYTM